MSDACSWTVEQGEEGTRLDIALSRRLSEPRARSQERITAGQVTVDDQPTGKAKRLVAGQRVAVSEPPAPQPPPVPDPVPVRYDDQYLAIVSKPADLVVHEGAGVTSGTLVDALQAMDVALAPAGGPGRPGIVHRLDRGTSGLLMVAKTDEAYHGLVALLAQRAVERRYWALVDGIPDPPRATIDAPIARDTARRTRFRTDPSGRPAVTHYDVEETFESAARLTVRLETGRTHQVRVHLSAVGHPVAGDRLYGASGAAADALRLDRPALHAAHLAFTHPLSGARVEVDEPLPPDLEEAVATLRASPTR